MKPRVKTFRVRHRMCRKFLLGFILLFSMTALNSGTYLNGSQVVEKSHWQLYIEGMQHYKQGAQQDNEKAIQFFRKSIERNNRFALAYIGLARCYINNVNYGWDESLEWLDKAENILEKANALSPGRVHYYHALIRVYLARYIRFDLKTGDIAFKLAEKALRKYPDHPKIISIAGYCFFLEFGETGKREAFDKALELKEKAFEQDMFGKDNLVLAELLLLNKDFKRALELCSHLRISLPHEMLDARMGQIYYYSGELRGTEVLFTLPWTSPQLKAFGLEYLGMIAAQKNDTEKARQILKDLDTLSVEPPGSRLRRASILMGLGEEDQGFDQFDAFFAKTYPQRMRYVYRIYIDLDKNFEQVRDKIRRRYYEPKTKN